MPEEPQFTVDEDSCPACHDGNHERCKRTLMHSGWDRPCSCYQRQVKEHARLFHRVALERMEQALRNSGHIVIPTTESLVVYQVQIVSTWYGGNTYGLHLTMEGARADAQARLDEFAKMIDEEPEVKDSTEQLTTRRLTWNDEEDWFMAGHEKIMVDHIAPFAWFAEGSAFKIVKVKIMP